MNTYIDNLNWRYATKQFDSTKKISETDLDFLKKALQLSASSYGLQPYEILIVENPEVRQQLLPFSWNQQQVVDASHLFILANKVNIDDSLVDDYLQNVSDTRGVSIEDLQGYSEMMKSNIMPLPEEVKNSWTSKQTYIALGNLLSAAATLRIDACPMEGFDSEQYNKILGLNERNLNASLVIPVGYRSENDNTQHFAKVRKPEHELFTTI
ncbi:NAD(P)H-dependent oxidoreductase [Mangrovimonas aestuarii]|uniref:NAD(P)H-dependent oxidoreductase n=1 Tax=Mangrovimonas aestuarii TaxID=3018443 RepID=UPI00237918D3|nr:NAD(P)H-dependent oxidoreductase [Mangrovimonas aestuarii]